MRENLFRVLAGVRWPAARWEVITEADAWGVSGVLRQQLVLLPDGRYSSLEMLVEVLIARIVHGVVPRPAGAGARPGVRGPAHHRVAPAPPALHRPGRAPA